MNEPAAAIVLISICDRRITHQSPPLELVLRACPPHLFADQPEGTAWVLA